MTTTTDSPENSKPLDKPTPIMSAIRDVHNDTSLNEVADEDICITVQDLCLAYGEKDALFDITMHIPRQKVTALIGPSGCGKSTLLRCFNRMNDLIDEVQVTGLIELNGLDIHSKEVDVAQLRRRVGMVFQHPILSQSQSLKMLPMG